MTGEELYQEYTAHAADLSATLRRNEALPAWAFIDEELRDMWDDLAALLEWKKGV